MGNIDDSAHGRDELEHVGQTSLLEQELAKHNQTALNSGLMTRPKGNMTTWSVANLNAYTWQQFEQPVFQSETFAGPILVDFDVFVHEKSASWTDDFFKTFAGDPSHKFNKHFQLILDVYANLDLRAREPKSLKRIGKEKFGKSPAYVVARNQWQGQMETLWDLKYWKWGEDPRVREGGHLTVLQVLQRTGGGVIGLYFPTPGVKGYNPSDIFAVADNSDFAGVENLVVMSDLQRSVPEKTGIMLWRRFVDTDPEVRKFDSEVIEFWNRRPAKNHLWVAYIQEFDSDCAARCRAPNATNRSHGDAGIAAVGLGSSCLC